MTKHAKRSTSTAIEEALKIVRDTGETTAKIGRDGAGEIFREVTNMNHLARECVDMCNGMFSAGVESSRAASYTFQEMSHQLMGNVNRAFSENAELLTGALSCRTIHDMAKWQEDVLQRTFGRYCDEMEALGETLFDGCNKAVEPLRGQSSHAASKIRKAVAA